VTEEDKLIDILCQILTDEQLEKLKGKLINKHLYYHASIIRAYQKHVENVKKY